MSTIEEFAVKVTATGLGNLDKVAKGAETARSKIDGLAAGILGVSFGAFIAGALNAADRISDLSDATGLAIVNVKAFETALETSGGKAKNVERIILGFSQSIDTAADGSDKMREAFAKVGVTLTDLQNLSEQDLLQKTIQGLDELKRSGASASEVASTGAQLLTKAFRGVDVSRFFADFESGKITLAGVADEIKKSADANARLEATYRSFQQGAIQAIQPIINLTGESTLTTEAASKMVTFLGVALGLTFGAQMVARIIALNTAILGTAAAAALVGKNPLIKLLAGIGLTALGSAGALEVYDQALKAVEESQKKMAASGGATPDQPTGKVGRKLALSPSQKAELDSEKRIAQSIADIRKNVNLQGANDLIAIEENAAGDIATAKAEIYNKENVSRQQMDKEFAVKSAEIQLKAALDIAKYRMTLNAKIFSEEEAQRQKGLEETAAYKKKLEETSAAAISQVDAIKQQNDELQNRFDLQQSIINLSTIDQERQTKIFDAIQQQKKALDDLNKKQKEGLPTDERTKREQEINAELERQLGLINKIADAKIANENDFAAGFKQTMKQYEESLKPLEAGKQTAEAVFGNMNRALDNFVQTGKMNFGDLSRSIIQDLIKIELKQSAMALFSAAKNSLFSIFGLSGRAAGGPVSAGTPYIVGEKGPELFMPTSSGTIVANNKLSSGGSSAGASTTIINNISAIDSRSVQQLFAEHRMTLFGNVEQARRELPMRTR